MSKAPGAAEQKGGAPAATQTHTPKPAATPARGKSHEPAPGGCHAWGCKSGEKRFNFCDEHFDQFKFGLIKKTGEPVSDHEKKFEHYQAHKRKRSAQKVA